ncbi:MAG: hypothetical protein L0H74_04540 [Brachybacterium sp.]|nr:hypothetical protein [Brachybacterium sp.]
MVIGDEPQLDEVSEPALSEAAENRPKSSRDELKKRSHSTVDETWAGSVPARDGVAPEGFSTWVGRQHFFTTLLTIPLIRSGLTIITDHPRSSWARHSTAGKEWLREEVGALRPAVLGGGEGGDNNDHEFFGYRQSI